MTLLKKSTLSFLVLFLFSFPAFAADKAKESVYDRVIRTGTIKCGYVVYPPLIMKDPNTGVLSGIAHDLMEYAAQALSLTIDWAEETGTASMIDGLKGDRFDLMCNLLWASPGRAREALYTDPVMYTAIHAYARANDTRFDGDLDRLNDPAYKISVMDGSLSPVIAAADFPKAQTVSLTELTDFSHLLLEVSSGKADVTFSEKTHAEDFLKKNPDSIRRIPLDHPVRVFGNAFLMKRGETDFQQMLNASLTDAQNQGVVERIIRRYETYPGSYYRVIKPYATPVK